MAYLPNYENGMKLAEALPKLAEKDRQFAASLAAKAMSGKFFSEKMNYWFDVMLSRALDESPKPAAPAPVSVGNFAPVIAMFDAAKSKLKAPKIRLALKDGGKIVLKLAGAKSAYQGQVNVTNGGGFDYMNWYGRISVEGAFTANQKQDPKLMEAVVELLKELAGNPKEVAAVYGQKYGNCCFCGKELTDSVSVAMGYGPICADNYGLPYSGIGSKPKKSKKAKAVEVAAVVVPAEAFGNIPPMVIGEPAPDAPNGILF